MSDKQRKIRYQGAEYWVVKEDISQNGIYTFLKVFALHASPKFDGKEDYISFLVLRFSVSDLPPMLITEKATVPKSIIDCCVGWGDNIMLYEALKVARDEGWFKPNKPKGDN